MKGKTTNLKCQGSIIYLILILFLVPAITVLAEDVRDVGGYIWKRMKYDNKCYYVTGYFAGLKKTEEIISIEVESEKRQKFAFTELFYVYQIRNKIHSYSPDKSNSDLKTLIKLLNAFYSNKYNLNIKFEDALRIVLARQKGYIEKSDFWLKEVQRNALKK